MDFRNALSQDFAHMQSIIVKEYKRVHSTLMEVSMENQSLRAELDDVQQHCIASTASDQSIDTYEAQDTEEPLLTLTHLHKREKKPVGAPKGLFPQQLVSKAVSMIPCASVVRARESSPNAKPITPREHAEQQALEHLDTATTYNSGRPLTPMTARPLSPGEYSQVSTQPTLEYREGYREGGEQPMRMSGASLSKVKENGEGDTLEDETLVRGSGAEMLGEGDSNAIEPQPLEEVDLVMEPRQTSTPEAITERWQILVAAAISPAGRTCLEASSKKDKPAEKKSFKVHEAWLKSMQTLERHELEVAKKLAKLQVLLDPSTGAPMIQSVLQANSSKTRGRYSRWISAYKQPAQERV